jgi:hypothetical protein
MTLFPWSLAGPRPSGRLESFGRGTASHRDHITLEMLRIPLRHDRILPAGARPRIRVSSQPAAIPAIAASAIVAHESSAGTPSRSRASRTICV